MKIVLFDYVFERDKPGITGLSAVIWEFAKRLITLGEEVYIIGPYRKGTQGPDGAVLVSYPLLPLSDRNIIGHIITTLRGWRQIKGISSVNIILAPEYLSTAVFSLLGQTSVVLWAAGNIYERIDSGANPFDPITTLVFKLAAQISAKRCAHIIAISRDMKSWWEYSGAPPHKVTVIPRGVDTSLFFPVPEARVQLGWNPTQWHILFVGRLSYEKGPDVLLSALSKMGDDKWRLHMVGNGPEYGKLLFLAQKLGIAESITFHGWIDKPKLPCYYSAADVCIVPSRSEPMGRVILEAMACQTLVIGAKVGGIPDLVKDGETGILFEKGNPEDLYRKLKTALENRQRAMEMSLAAYKFVHRNLSWEGIAKRVCNEVFRPILEARP